MSHESKESLTDLETESKVLNMKILDDKMLLAMSTDMFHVKIHGVRQDIHVRRARVRLFEPWSVEIKNIIDVVMGEGREGQV